MVTRTTWRVVWSAMTSAAVLTACAGGNGADWTTAGGDDSTSTAGPVQTSGGEPSPVSPADSATHPVTTVVISGDPAVASAGVPAPEAWPAVLAGRLRQAGAPMAVTTAATEDGAGFVPAASAPSFTDLVRAHVRHSTQLVMFHDAGPTGAAADDLETAAATAFERAEEAAPDARIVLIVTDDDDDAREAFASAARGAELPVTLVDATIEGWPASPRQEQFADLLAPHLVELVGAIARSGALE